MPVRRFALMAYHRATHKASSVTAERPADFALQLKGNRLDEGHDDEESEDPDEDVEPLRAGARMALRSAAPVA